MTKNVLSLRQLAALVSTTCVMLSLSCTSDGDCDHYCPTNIVSGHLGTGTLLIAVENAAEETFDVARDCQVDLAAKFDEMDNLVRKPVVTCSRGTTTISLIVPAAHDPRRLTTGLTTLTGEQPKIAVEQTGPCPFRSSQGTVTVDVTEAQGFGDLYTKVVTPNYSRAFDVPGDRRGFIVRQSIGDDGALRDPVGLRCFLRPQWARVPLSLGVVQRVAAPLRKTMSSTASPTTFVSAPSLRATRAAGGSSTINRIAGRLDRLKSSVSVVSVVSPARRSDC